MNNKSTGNAAKNRKENIRNIALCAVLSALSIVLLFLGSILDVLDLTCGALASLFVIWAVIEIKGYWPFLIWGVTSLVSMLVLPTKFASVFYLVFCGVYPILKAKFERFNFFLSWLFKLLYANAMIAAFTALTKFVFITADSKLDFTIPIFIFGNLAFIIYDIASSRLITIYIVRLRTAMKMDRLFGRKQ